VPERDVARAERLAELEQRANFAAHFAAAEPLTAEEETERARLRAWLETLPPGSSAVAAWRAAFAAAARRHAAEEEAAAAARNARAARHGISGRKLSRVEVRRLVRDRGVVTDRRPRSAPVRHPGRAVRPRGRRGVGRARARAPDGSDSDLPADPGLLRGFLRASAAMYEHERRRAARAVA
jgi:hypothetical protein